jgi:hypothetical protein
MAIQDIETYFKLKRVLKNQDSERKLFGIPEEERIQVLKTALSVYPEVMAWTDQSGLETLRQRVPATCLAMAATMPYIQSSILIKATIFGLIMFAVDDVTDAVIGTKSLEQQEAMLTLLIAITKSGGELTFRDFPKEVIKAFSTHSDNKIWIKVALVWGKACREIKEFRSSSLYYCFFDNRTESDLEATRIELRWAQTATKMDVFPTYEQYLQIGCQSIITSIFFTFLLVMIEKPVDSEFSSPLKALMNKVFLVSGRCIRLANDIRSFERDLVENNLNAIHILMKTQNLTENEAEAFLFKEMNIFLEDLEKLISLLPSTLKEWGDMVKRLTWFSCNLYNQTEFHQLSKEMLVAMHGSVTTKPV